jgi:tetratricopeptide (TPR) repeat protein
VESVAWVAERKDVLSSFFLFLTLLSYNIYIKKRSLKSYLLVILLFILGLLSKPMLVTLPILLLLLDLWPLQRKDGWQALFKEKLPFFALSFISAVVTVFAQRAGGAVGSLAEFPFTVRLANAFYAYAEYLFKMLMPLKLAIFYPHPGTSLPVWQVVGCVLLLVMVSLVVVLQIKKHPYLAVGWLWYVATLVPVIGLVQVGKQAMADRYTYIPLIGIFVAVTWFLSDLAVGRSNVKQKRLVKPALSAAGVAVILILVPITWRHACYWHDSVTLFSRSVQVTQNNSTAQYNLGIALSKRKEYDKAIEHYKQTLKLDPSIPEVYYNWAIIISERGKLDEAIRMYRKAIKIKPDYGDAHSNLGLALANQGKLDEAEEHLTKAVEYNPANPVSRNNLGFVYAVQGRFEEAVLEFEDVLKRYPNDMMAHGNMGMVLAQQGDLEGAVSHYRLALKAEPDDVKLHWGLGQLF